MATCSVSEFFARCAKGNLPPVVLLGPGKAPFSREPFEPMLADQAVDALVERFVDPSLRDLALSVYYADEAEPGAIVGEAETLPFLAERRVVVVRNAERYSEASGDKGKPFAALARYLQAPSDSTILVFVATKADKRRQFYRGCENAGLVVECPQLTDAELRAWVENRVAKRGKSIRRDATEELLVRAGTALGDVNNAVDLVANFVGDTDSIRLEDVVAACADVAEESVWDLTDAISASNPDKALRALYQLIEFGNAPDQIMAVINWMIETAYRAAPETKATLKSAFHQKKLMPLVEKLGVAKLREACALCTDTHFLLRSTGVNQTLALELLVLKLSVRSGRRAARRA
jgi:DNA polymerase-3 subunit delta